MKNDATPFGGFTEQARVALKLAQEEAQRHGCPLIDPEHLLLGLLADHGSGAVRILRASGRELESVRAAVEKMMQQGEQVVEVARLSERTKHIIKLTVAEARRLDSSMIDTDHLLLGILREEQGGACEILNDLGISLDVVRMEVERARSEQAASTAPSLPTGTVQIDQERQKRALILMKSQGRILSSYIFAIAVAVVLFATSTIIFPQILTSIAEWIIALENAPLLSWQPLVGWKPLLVLFYSILATVFLVALFLPLTWLSGFRPLHRLGILKETTSAWLKRSLRSLGFWLLPIWLFIELIALLIIVQPQSWWAWAALAQFLYSLARSRFGLSLLIRSSKGKMRPVVEGEIVERLQMLLVRLQLPPCPLFIIKVSHRTISANAFFSGIGRGRRIRLTDTLVGNFTLDEIEVILAHELGHYVHHDIWRRLVMRGLTILALLYAIYLIFNPADVIPAPLAFLSGYLLFVGLVFGTFYLRRRHEYWADEFALQATGKVPAFKDAMTRLTNLGLNVANPSQRTRRPATHPTLAQRLQHADEFAARRSQAAVPVQV